MVESYFKPKLLLPSWSLALFWISRHSFANSPLQLKHSALLLLLGSLHASFYAQYGINFDIFTWRAWLTGLVRPRPYNLSQAINFKAVEQV